MKWVETSWIGQGQSLSGQSLKDYFKLGDSLMHLFLKKISQIEEVRLIGR